MILGTFLWFLSGVLMSFGLVGYFTGLLLLPLGVGLTVYAGRSHRSSWPCFLPESASDQ